MYFLCQSSLFVTHPIDIYSHPLYIFPPGNKHVYVITRNTLDEVISPISQRRAGHALRLLLSLGNETSTSFEML